MGKEKLLRLFAFQIIWLCLHSDNVLADPDSDKNMDLCVNGNCPWCLEIAPFFAKCEVNGKGYKFGHVVDCRKYFTCERNPEECERTPWGRMEHNCQEGQYFDVIGKECIASLNCPQECPPKADEKTGCKIDGTEPSTESDDCRSGFGCNPVQTCPASSYETYLTSGTISCGGEDEFYDAKHGKCVKAMACPQSVPEENCDLKWDLMAEKGWDRLPHKQYYFCRSWIPSLGQYSYGSLEMKEGSPYHGKCRVEQANTDMSGVNRTIPVDQYEVLSKDNHLEIGFEGEDRKAATYTFLGKKYTFIYCHGKIGKHLPSHRHDRYDITEFGFSRQDSYLTALCHEFTSYRLICQ